MLERWVVALAAVAALGAGAQAAEHRGGSEATAAPTVSAAEAPPGFAPAGVEWIHVRIPGHGVLLAAVARPAGAGPFPAAVVLHGSHGFAREYVELARDLAREGIVGVAACWFGGEAGQGIRFVTPIACNQAPPMPAHGSADALRSVAAIVDATGGLRGVDAGRVAVFGHSRGGGAALNYVLGGGRARAAVLHSAGYPAGLAQRIDRLAVPVLILHGTADGPSDGGSAVTALGMARAFEAALRRAGKDVEASYYQGGGHNGMFTSRAQWRDEVRRTAAFLRRHLLR
jgi:dienelactone hydrolase